MNPLAEAWRLLTSGDLHLWEIVLRSLYISGTALGLATLVGLPIGAAIGLSRFRLRGPTVALVNTALALPPVVVGLVVYLLLSRSGPLGSLGMLYSPGAMILAQTAIAAPYVAAISLAAASEVPPDLQLQARALGASRLEAILITLREARASLLAAVAAGFGAIISEVGAVMIVGGNILGETRVMTTAIVLETRRGNFGLAIALGAILLTIALAINLLLVSIGRADLRALASPIRWVPHRRALTGAGRDNRRETVMARMDETLLRPLATDGAGGQMPCGGLGLGLYAARLTTTASGGI